MFGEREKIRKLGVLDINTDYGFVAVWLVVQLLEQFLAFYLNKHVPNLDGFKAHL